MWVLGDFGLSVVATPGQLNKSSNIRGSMYTCAPELVNDSGRHDNRVDIWAFGCVAYALAKGEYPLDTHRCYNIIEFIIHTQEDHYSIYNHAQGDLIQDTISRISVEESVRPLVRRSLRLDRKNRASAKILVALATEQRQRADIASPLTNRLRDIDDIFYFMSGSDRFVLLHGEREALQGGRMRRYVSEFSRYYEGVLDLEGADALLSELSLQQRVNAGSPGRVGLQRWVRNHPHSLVTVRISPANEDGLFLQVLRVLVNSKVDIVFVCFDGDLLYVPLHTHVQWVLDMTGDVRDLGKIRESCVARGRSVPDSRAQTDVPRTSSSDAVVTIPTKVRYLRLWVKSCGLLAIMAMFGIYAWIRYTETFQEEELGSGNIDGIFEKLRNGTRINETEIAALNKKIELRIVRYAGCQSAMLRCKCV